MDWLRPSNLFIGEVKMSISLIDRTWNNSLYSEIYLYRIMGNNCEKGELGAPFCAALVSSLLVWKPRKGVKNFNHKVMFTSLAYIISEHGQQLICFGLF